MFNRARNVFFNLYNNAKQRYIFKKYYQNVVLTEHQLITINGIAAKCKKVDFISVARDKRNGLVRLVSFNTRGQDGTLYSTPYFKILSDGSIIEEKYNETSN